MGVAALAGTAGVISKTARPTLNIGTEAMGDENADRYFLGERGLSPGSLIDAHLGPRAAAGGSMLGAGIGAGIGAVAGSSIKKAIGKKPLTEALKIPEKFSEKIPLLGEKAVPRLGGKTLLKAGGKAKGLGMIGAIAGAAIGGTAFARGYVARNKDFMTQSPYNRGSAMQATATQAYGDVVLGMYNSRRG